MARTAATRRPLSRARVLDAAFAVADKEGLAAVSMRRLADQLGVVPMAIYKHVSNKEELLDGMVDLLIAEMTAPGPGLRWKAAVRERILQARRVVLRHSWARGAIESRRRRTPAVLGYMDSVTGLLRAGGFSDDLVHHVMHALGNRIWGFSPELFDDPDNGDVGSLSDEERAAMQHEFATTYPNILAIALAATNGDLSGVGQGCDEDFEFEFALDLLLDGADRLRKRGWRSTDRR